MLTSRQGTTTAPTTPEEVEVPALLEPDELLNHPKGLQTLVLALVCRFKAETGEPVRHEDLLWFVDIAPRHHDPDVTSLDSALGPRPRRKRLFLALGDLVDLGLLQVDPQGFYVTGRGHEYMEKLGDKAAQFKSVAEAVTAA